MNYKKLINDINNGLYDGRLTEIYVDNTLLNKQKERYINAIKKFYDLYHSEDIEIYSTPGRSEVCGNHTDHQNGKVVATSINLDGIAIVSKTDNDQINIVSDLQTLKSIDIKDLNKKQEEVGSSESLIRGVIKGLKDKKYMIGGFNAYITSDVKIGAGMSSSAQFEDLIGYIESGLYNNLEIDAVTIAKIGQYAENEYFEKPCGLMDQCACSVGGLITIDFKDNNNPIVQKIDVDFDNFNKSLCIVDVYASHADLTDEYAAIPKEMSEIAKYYNKSKLREVDEKQFIKDIALLRSKFGDRPVLRAMHLFEENKRVDEMVDALNQKNINKFLEIIKLSGDSSYKYLQNVYCNSNVQSQAVSIALAVSEKILGNKGVCRVHGGGFAGTIQAFVDNDFVDSYKQQIESVFPKDSCHVLKIRQLGGIKVF